MASVSQVSPPRNVDPIMWMQCRDDSYGVVVSVVVVVGVVVSDVVAVDEGVVVAVVVVV